MVSKSLHKAKKSFGQHFLHDTDVLDLMCSELSDHGQDPILEIGPGTGTLTQHLVETGRPVFAIEKDPSLYGHLATLFSSYSHFTLIKQDILEYDPPAEWAGSYDICANIPYYITQPIITKFLYHPTPPRSITLLVQHEVGEKYTVDQPPFTFLSASAHLVADISYLAFVPRQLFSPPPKVDSAIITFHPKSGVQPLWLLRLIQLQKTCFTQGRKKLGNTLPPHMKGKIQEKLPHLMEQRPEMISPATWFEMGKVIFE